MPSISAVNPLDKKKIDKKHSLGIFDEANISDHTYSYRRLTSVPLWLYSLYFECLI